MTVVVDTDVLIDHLRGRQPARGLIEDGVSGDRPIVASLVTRIELLAGTRVGEETSVRHLFDFLEWAAVDEAIADRAGDLSRCWRASHPGIDLADYIIAATAQELGATLWTRNVRHYPMVPGLRAAY